MSPPNPILVEARRGGLVECVHRGAVAIAGPDGALVHAVGDVDRPIFPRSAKKLLQALPLVESGAADAAGLAPRHLALACASHSGEARHVAAVREMLSGAGASEAALACGPGWPSLTPGEGPALAARGGRPRRAHNACSGKHAGFLALARRLDAPLEGYLDPAHPAQRAVRAAFEETTGGPVPDAGAAVDGCSAPTLSASLAALARAFATLASGVGHGAARRAAAALLFDACMAEPWAVAGAGRVCTELMAAAPGEVFAKTGAEGVYVVVAPRLGRALALKIDDGATRAGEAAAAAALPALFGPAASDAVRGASARFARRPVRDYNGRIVGALESVPF